MQAPNNTRRIDISFVQPQTSKIGRTLLTAFTIHNDTPDQLPAQRLQLIGNQYWRSTCSTAVPSIAPYSKCKPVWLEMRCQYTSDPALVPQTFTVCLDRSAVERVFKLCFWTFTQALRDYHPAGLEGALGADKFNLLCFGQAGSGKSSFFNSAMTLLHEGKIVCLMV